MSRISSMSVASTPRHTLIDRRKTRGLRYPLALIVTIAVLAKLAGYSRVEEVADWAKLRAQELQLLFTTKRAQMPHHTSWSRILGQAVDVADLERLAQQFVVPPTTVGEIPDRRSIEVALDGKTLRWIAFCICCAPPTLGKRQPNRLCNRHAVRRSSQA
jgi:hypothetical protein